MRNIIICALLIINLTGNIIAVEKKIRIKQNIFKEIHITDSKLRSYASFKVYNNILIMQGRVLGIIGNDLSPYFEIYSYPDFNFKYRENLSVKEYGGITQGVYTNIIPKDDRIYIYGDSKNEKWFLYYDLEKFEKHKVRERFIDNEKLFSEYENGYISYGAYIGIYILDKDFNLMKTITRDEIMQKCGFPEIKSYNTVASQFLDGDNLFVRINLHKLGLINLKTSEIKLIPNQDYELGTIMKLSNTIYTSMCDRKNQFYPIFKYNYSTNELTRIDDNIANMFFTKSLDAQYNDLTFLYSYAVTGYGSNELIIIQGDLERAIKLKVKKFKKIQYVKNIVPYKDKNLIATGNGLYEFDINEIYKLLEIYGEKVPTKILELP